MSRQIPSFRPFAAVSSEHKNTAFPLFSFSFSIVFENPVLVFIPPGHAQRPFTGFKLSLPPIARFVPS